MGLPLVSIAPAPSVIRVLIVSAIRLYRDGLAQALGRDERMHVVGAFETVPQSICSLDSAPKPDVVLLDTADPNALVDMRMVSGEFPGAKVVALGVSREDADIIACAEAGIAGYVFRDASIEELFDTVESSARGELRCSPEMAGTLLRRVANLARLAPRAASAVLTRREHEILELIDHGCSNKEIAARLSIEITTVKNHIHNILDKLDVHTRAEAAAKLRRGGSGSTVTPVPGSVRSFGL